MEQESVPVAMANKVKVKKMPKACLLRVVKSFVLILLSIIAGGFGAWLLLVTDLVKLNGLVDIDENREKIVLQEGEVIADVFDKVGPSTVSITTESIGSLSSYYGWSEVSQGAGSGVIISADGYVMTNRHVVSDDVDVVNVVTSDGVEYKDVDVIGRDVVNDIAFLKIPNVDNLTPAVIGDSDSVVAGHKVVAIGNALGLFSNSVTSGIISGLGRPIEADDTATGGTEELENLLQTDAAINPGNSGGPLVNLDGEVIGINTAISQEGQSIGFAIPINDVKGAIDSVLESGRIARSYIGVRYVSLNLDISDQLGLDVTEGALIRANDGAEAVMSDGPASKAGLREGDIITQVDQIKLQFGRSLRSVLGRYSVGDVVDVYYLRDGESLQTQVTLEEYK